MKKCPRKCLKMCEKLEMRVEPVADVRSGVCSRVPLPPKEADWKESKLEEFGTRTLYMCKKYTFEKFTLEAGNGKGSQLGRI